MKEYNSSIYSFIIISRVLLPLTRRKGLYVFLSCSSVLFIITALLNDFNEGGKFDTVKLITGVMSKFILTCFFSFAYLSMGELNPTAIRQTVIAIQQ